MMSAGRFFSQEDLLAELLGCYDVLEATVDYAIVGSVTTTDLWRLYEDHRIMAPADAWLLAAMWEDQIPDRIVNRTLADPSWWRWYDRGILDARER